MKKILIAIAAISLLAASCKKDIRTQTGRDKPAGNANNGKKYKVTYTLDGFSQTTKPISLKASARSAKKIKTAAVDSLSQAITEFYYIVYNSAGDEIKRIKRFYGAPVDNYYHEDGVYYSTSDPLGLEYRATTDPYNVITDSLAAGTYTIVITGSDDELSANNHNSQWADFENIVYYPLVQAKVYQSQALDVRPVSQVIYFGKTTITVGSGDSAHGITINRVVGQVEVNIEDAIPANVSSISIAAIGNHSAFLFNSETSAEPGYIEDEVTYNFITRQVTAADIGTTNFKVAGYIMNITTPISIVVKAFDSQQNLITFKRIDNVQFSKNKRTILSGHLFTPNTSPQQFNIYLNQAWNADVNIDF
ncbi:hypothetical protein [Mucilaginibacter aquariorum]|uniref:FimB/Mfa2 family fimbrial subunit n=1 Tax=Mucilaginibacter aquariorum TaxID=2967225 RepID=A0ABT1SZ11_9SPHI|nr:hypothetical protein [Mucilaginibacter aquariorum]MCQ6957585.1 hypothetical protein [Mucilaginibacter aquariorum]